MKVDRIAVKACCGTTTTSFKLGTPISKDFLPYLVSAGFIEAKHFTASGMLYAENDAVIISGNFGNNIVHAKCKTTNCGDSLNNIEQLLTKMESTWSTKVGEV